MSRVRAYVAEQLAGLACHRRLIGLLLAVGVLAGSAAVGPILTLVTAAVVVAAGATVNARRLLRQSMQLHARHRSYGPCRGAGLLGLGVALSGLTALLTGIVAVTAGPERASVVPAVGTFAAAVASLLGLLLLPGAAPTLGARLRRVLDGAGIALSLMFAAWLIVGAPSESHPTGPVPQVPLAVALMCCITIAVAMVTGVRAARHRPAALSCASGVALSVLGLTALTVELGAAADPFWLAGAGLVLYLGPALIGAGSRRAGDVPRQVQPGDADGTLAGYPLLVVPIGAAVAAAVYHFFLDAGSFDRTAVTLGAFGAAAVALREVLTAFDVRRYARRLAEQEARFRTLVTGSGEMALVLADDLTVRWQSPAAARLFGLSDQDVLGRLFPTLLHHDDADQAATSLHDGDRLDAPLEARLRDGYGQWREVEVVVRDQRRDPEVGALVVHVRDVAERAELRRELDRRRWYDELTGLVNRRRLIAEAQVLGSGSLLVVELDRFAGVNDLHGGDVADAVLVEAANRLRNGAGPDDVVARLGTDMFAVLTPASRVRAYSLATRLLTLLAAPYEPPGRTVHLSADIGVADLGGADPEEVLRQADLARRHARQLGRGRAECYDASLEAVHLRRTAIEQHLPGVADRGELDLVFQPIVELPSRLPVGVEALVRWRNARLGLVSPLDFLPVAESLGIADEIVTWVLHQACRQLSVWRREDRDLWMSVNVSPRQLTCHGFLPTLAAALEAHQVPADRLVVEVGEVGPGERGMFDDPAVVDRLAGLRQLGVRTAIDHFGTGPTTLAHLRHLPVDVLKIDRAVFTEPAGQSGPASPIIDVVVTLARRLGVEVIAAGLEAESHVSVVRSAGCEYGQGFLLARPEHAEHTEAFLERWRGRRLSY